MYSPRRLAVFNWEVAAQCDDPDVTPGSCIYIYIYIYICLLIYSLLLLVVVVMISIMISIEIIIDFSIYYYD